MSDECEHYKGLGYEDECVPCLKATITELEAENKALREAAKAAVDEKDRLSTYLGVLLAES